MRALRDRLWAGLRDVAELHVNGDMQRRIANNLNVSIALDNCDALVTSVTDIAVSSTAACSSGSATPSHVLQALGTEASSTIRISVGRFNTEEEIEHAVVHLRQKLDECRAQRALAPA
jgi:cysteine desulfurase